MIKTTTRLKNLHMTPNGFKNLLHSYILSPLMYQMYIITPTKSFWKEVEKIATEFLWSGKRARVAFDNLVHPYEKFGIGLWKPSLRSQV